MKVVWSLDEAAFYGPEDDNDKRNGVLIDWVANYDCRHDGKWHGALLTQFALPSGADRAKALAFAQKIEAALNRDAGEF